MGSGDPEGETVRTVLVEHRCALALALAAAACGLAGFFPSDASAQPALETDVDVSAALETGEVAWTATLDRWIEAAVVLELASRATRVDALDVGAGEVLLSNDAEGSARVEVAATHALRVGDERVFVRAGGALVAGPELAIDAKLGLAWREFEFELVASAGGL